MWGLDLCRARGEAAAATVQKLIAANAELSGRLARTPPAQAASRPPATQPTAEPNMRHLPGQHC